ncbi:MAG: hypothetical protein ACTSWD_04915 [Candidatus Heimdallarchaeota archaeon]
MEEIKLYYDIDRKQEVKGDIEFDPVVAGKKAKRELYIFNELNFRLDIELSLEGKDIQITKKIKGLIPKDIKRIEFELSPKLTTMKPVKAKLKIKLDYIVR